MEVLVAVRQRRSKFVMYIRKESIRHNHNFADCQNDI